MSKRGVFGAIADWFRAKSLEHAVASGQKPWGRQDVKMPAKTTIEAKVIRADGTVEDLGVISETTGEVSASQLEKMRR